MMIKVKAFARFREAFGNARSVEPDGKPAAVDMLTGLCVPHGSHDLIFDESGRIRKYVNILVNGRHTQTKFADGDEVAVFPPVAGG